MSELLQRLLSVDAAIYAAVLAYVFKEISAHLRKRTIKRTVTRALLTEVHALNEAVCLRKLWWDTEVKDQLKSRNWLPPLIPFATDAYDHLTDKVPALDPDVA